MAKKTQLYMDKEKSKAKQRNSIIAVVILCILAAAGYFAYSYFKPAPYGVTLNNNGDLVIPVSELNEDISYIEHKALPQDLMVLLNYGDSPRVAFDTCEECYSSGNAHYSYNDGTLICGNCYNSYEADSLGEANWGGCQPVAIPTTFRMDTDGEIIIPVEVLAYAKDMFKSWDGGNYNIGFDDYIME